MASIILLPLSSQTGIAKDIPYAESGDPLQRLDLYCPAKKQFPTIVYLHEGSLKGGDKSEPPYSKIAEAFQSHGVGFALVNYRLFPANPWPAPIQDASRAFKWVKTHIQSMGGDPSQVYVMGHSSGAQLAGLLSTDVSYLKANNLGLRDIAGTILMGTLMSDPLQIGGRSKESQEKMWAKYLKPDWPSADAFVQAWPMAHINKDIPRMLILIAEAETTNPPILSQAIEYEKACEALGVSIHHEVLPNRTHMTAMQKLCEAGDPNTRLILDFLRIR
ncbi:MAG: alpha/beta hydrolase [Armatimonadetes bacterium]|nr:alpha/beta hydrolase [Armatimonadota bacterium]